MTQYMYGAFPPLPGGHPSAYQWRDHADRLGAVSVRQFDAYAGITVEVLDQLWTSGCVPHAVVGSAEAQVVKLGGNPGQLSPMFLWWYGRIDAGYQGQNQGTFPHDVLTEFRNRGDCRRDLYPLTQDAVGTGPSTAAVQDAASRTGCAFYQSQSLDELFQSMPTLGVPGIITLAVTPSFENPVNGLITLRPAEQILGYHCVQMRSFNLDAGTCRIRNSWGPNWGAAGEADIQIDQLRTLTQEYWTMTIGDSMKPQPKPQPQPEPTTVKTLADYDQPLKDTINDPSYDFNQPAMRQWLIAWVTWMEGSTEMKQAYQAMAPAEQVAALRDLFNRCLAQAKAA